MNIVYIDLRALRDYQAGHIEGAINVSPEQIMSGMDSFNIPKDAHIVAYCYSGARSNTAINILRSQGYLHLTNGINIDHIKKESSGHDTRYYYERGGSDGA